MVLQRYEIRFSGRNFVADVVCAGAFSFLQCAENRSHLDWRGRKIFGVRGNEYCDKDRDATVVLIELWKRRVQGYCA